MNSSSYQLSEIWIYPIKSIAGIRVPRAKVLPKGLEYDRRYMICDSDGQAITQRTHPQLALFKTSIEGDQLIIRFQNDKISLPLNPTNSLHKVHRQIFDDKVEVLEQSEDYNEWFSQRLGSPCSLVFFPEEFARPVAKDFQINNEHVSLADAYPVLIIGEESLNELNRKLEQPLPMNRFRPNLVFTGGGPFDEDTFRNFSIGPSKFAAVKPCARCVLTTVNQDTGKKGTEPLRTLATFRSQNNKIYFGQNVLVLDGTEIRAGDQLIVTSYK